MFASRLWRLAKLMAERELGKVSEPDPELVDRAVEELADIMAFTYMMRVRLSNRRRSASKDVSLNLSFRSDARRIADRFDLDLGRIRDNFQVYARRGVMKSVRDIRKTMGVALRQATLDELPTPAATKSVIDQLRRHGISPRSTWYIENLVRTHAAISYGLASWNQYQGDVDLWGFEYVTVGDNRVREEHEAMEGVRRHKDDPFWLEWWPPNGWSCRCQAVAIYDTSARQTPVPKGHAPDEGFETNFTYLLAA